MDDLFNDKSYGHMIADTMLFNRGLKATYVLITVKAPTIAHPKWNIARGFAAHGHEIGNHSHTHSESWVDNPLSYAIEIDTSTALINAALPGRRCIFFAFPFDVCNQQVKDYLAEQGYIGCRGDIKGQNDPVFDPFNIKFYNYSTITGGVAEWTSGAMNSKLDNTIKRGRWEMLEMHGVADESHMPIPADVFGDHLDFCVQQCTAGNLWMATAGEVIKYRQEAQNYTITVTQPQNDLVQIAFSALVLDTTLYNTSLTISFIPASGQTVVSASQDGAQLPVTAMPEDTVRFNAFPFRGVVDVTVSGTISILHRAIPAPVNVQLSGSFIFSSPEGFSNKLRSANMNDPAAALTIFDVLGKTVFFSASDSYPTLRNTGSGLYYILLSGPEGQRSCLRTLKLR
jgi:hypothetical protein